MNEYLRDYVQEVNEVHKSRDKMMEDIAFMKSKLKKARSKYEKYTLENYEKEKEDLKKQCDNLENKLQIMMRKLKESWDTGMKKDFGCTALRSDKVGSSIENGKIILIG